MTYFGSKTANFAERWRVCTPCTHHIFNTKTFTNMLLWSMLLLLCYRYKSIMKLLNEMWTLDSNFTCLHLHVYGGYSLTERSIRHLYCSIRVSHIIESIHVHRGHTASQNGFVRFLLFSSFLLRGAHPEKWALQQEAITNFMKQCFFFMVIISYIQFTKDELGHWSWITWYNIWNIITTPLGDGLLPLSIVWYSVFKYVLAFLFCSSGCLFQLKKVHLLRKIHSMSSSKKGEGSSGDTYDVRLRAQWIIWYDS